MTTKISWGDTSTPAANTFRVGQYVRRDIFMGAFNAEQGCKIISAIVRRFHPGQPALPAIPAARFRRSGPYQRHVRATSASPRWTPWMRAFLSPAPVERGYDCASRLRRTLNDGHLRWLDQENIVFPGLKISRYCHRRRARHRPRPSKSLRPWLVHAPLLPSKKVFKGRCRNRGDHGKRGKARRYYRCCRSR